ncbi:MAG: hypothetical protein R3282_00305 [Rhodothermales bacterium]|nr:hypothetical protein [Rhodothermales bacterium]
MSEEEAEARVRAVLAKQVTRSYMSAVMEKNLNQVDAAGARRLKKELARISDLELVSIDVRRPIPDYLLRPHMPAHVVRVVMRDDSRQYAPRYFWLPWADVDSETSKYAWMFSI